jgi:TetR/AcrR family transcriptional repressor of nem operon
LTSIDEIEVERNLILKKHQALREYLSVLTCLISKADSQEKWGKAMAILSTMVGALTLSRVVNDPRLAQSFLDAAAENVREAAFS